LFVFIKVVRSNAVGTYCESGFKFEVSHFDIPLKSVANHISLLLVPISFCHAISWLSFQYIWLDEHR